MKRHVSLDQFIDVLKTFSPSAEGVLLKKIKAAGWQRLSIYAAGYIGARLYERLQEEGIQVEYVFDTQAESVHLNKIFSNILDVPEAEILPITALDKLASKNIVIASEEFHKEIREHIQFYSNKLSIPINVISLP